MWKAGWSRVGRIEVEAGCDGLEGGRKERRVGGCDNGCGGIEGVKMWWVG